MGLREDQETINQLRFLSILYVRLIPAVASVVNQPSMKGHFDAACAKENDCILAQLPPFFSLGVGKGEGEAY